MRSSIPHRLRVASGGLLDEVGRCSDATRDAYTDGMIAIIDDIAAHLELDDPAAARVTMFSVFASMVGAVQLSRAIADAELADAILEQGIANALALLDIARSR